MTDAGKNQSKGLTGLHILVVEDETAIAMMLEDMLLDLGCNVVLAPSIEKPIASIHQHSFDGVLLDMNIHGRQTTPIAEELVNRSIPFLLVTGYGAGLNDPPLIKSAARLQKPFNAEDLARRMIEVFINVRFA